MEGREERNRKENDEGMLYDEIPGKEYKTGIN